MKKVETASDHQETLSDSRREFFKKLLAGAATATVLMVIKAPTDDVSAGEISPDGEPEHEYAFVIDINNCIGCGNCVRACERENDVPPGMFRTWVERYVLTDDGVYVDSPNGGHDGFEELDAEIRDKAKAAWFVPKMCNHCADPPCVQVCPVGATFRSPEGFVLIDPDHCIGCAYCVQACPYGARFINPKTRKADKCTWCYHRVKRGMLPACVTVCPTRARLFGDLKNPEDEVFKIFQQDEWTVLKPHMYTEPVCFYIGKPREVV